MVRFIHAADIHLDSPLVGLRRYPGAPADEVRSATRRAFENLVAYALETEVDLLLIAGDLYDGDWRDYNTGLFLVAQLSRLAREGVRTVMISGNHDAASRITRSLRLPPGVTLLSSRHPESIFLEQLGLAVHGQGYESQAVTCDLSATYPDPRPGFFNIGLLHTSADGREGHEAYAPCSLPALCAHGYDYWALGHVHRREVLAQQPWVLFPGNLQGRHIRESGDKGATVVTVEDGRVTAVKHEALDVLRWATLPVSAQEVSRAGDLIERVTAAASAAAERADGRILALRVLLQGASPAHAELSADGDHWVNEMRSALLAAGVEAWLEQVRFDTTAPLADAALTPGHPLHEVVASLVTACDDEDLLVQVTTELSELFSRLPFEYRQGTDAVDLADPVCLAARLRRAHQLLLPRLLSGGEL